jgi:hypothetical protein
MSVPNIPYTPLRPRPATRLCPLARQRGDPCSSQRGQGKSDLPWAVNQRPFDPYRVGAKVYWAYRASGRPAPQTTLRRALMKEIWLPCVGSHKGAMKLQRRWVPTWLGPTGLYMPTGQAACGEILPCHGPLLHSSHYQLPAIAGLACNLVEML